MRYLFVAAMMCAAQPAAAFDRMLLSDCQASFERLAELVDPASAETKVRLRSISATFDGWCKIDGGAPGFDDVEFDTFIWRSEETSRWVNDEIPPLGLQLRITGLDPDSMEDSPPTNRPPVTVDATLRQDPAAGQVILEQVVMANDAGDRVTLSGVFDRVFLSSPSMMQVSVGSAVFKAGLMSLTLDGTHRNPFGAEFSGSFNVDGNLREGDVFSTISSLPDGVIDDASRAELTAFAEDLPKPVGTLDIVVGSERGLGLMQVGAAMYNLATYAAGDSTSGNSGGRELGILFDGITVSADWAPRDGQTD